MEGGVLLLGEFLEGLEEIGYDCVQLVKSIVYCFK